MHRITVLGATFARSRISRALMERAPTVAAAVVLLVAVAVPAFAADQAADLKAVKEQVKSLQDAGVVMKEDLAKTQLQLAEQQAQDRAQAEAAKRQTDGLAKQIAELRQALADEKAAHEAALAKQQAEYDAALAKEQAEAARQRDRAKKRQTWLYLAGAIALVAATR